MRLLLDSHVLLWWFDDDASLSAHTRDAIRAGAEDVLVSAASVWEIELKRAKGKLSAPRDLIDRIESSGFRHLAITPDHARDAARLPRHHGDPFDRMLVAQAQAEAAVLVTHDETLSAYDVPVLRARA